MKLDLSKAHDRSFWLYLRVILLHIGFGVQMVNWIMGCLSSISFVIIIYGSTSRFFKPSRRLRQGCPLAPLLFLIFVEGLCRSIV
jgi:hypothetical protein